MNFFRKIFSKQSGSNGEEKIQQESGRFNEATTAPLTEEQLLQISEETQKIEPPQLVVGIGHHTGRQRENNEDSIFCFNANISVDTAKIPMGIFVVSDGMGGHQNGEVASEKAVRTIGAYVTNHLFDPLFGLSSRSPDESLQEIMRNAVLEANREVLRSAPGGGATVTAVLVINSQMTIAHIGDSRAYSIYLDGRIRTLTRDHSLVERLKELGQISDEEAATHPQKSMLYRALGQNEMTEPDLFTASLPTPGYLLICSDGLWGLVDESEIFRIIADAPNPQRACQNLVDAANAAGGVDNIAIVLAKMAN
ncbi:MAG: serine/threonine-protein phosphatase [Anaerolineales bacterium]|nr:serine/threonine-protein phosphatase [Anaerolineales bacterium]